MRRFLSSSLLALSAALAAPASVHALSYQMIADQTLLEQAGGVAVFEVLQVAEPRPGDTETRYLVGWRRHLAGAPVFAYEWLALPGADAGKSWHQVDGIPLLEPGQQWLVFHQRRADGVLQPVQLTLGMFLHQPDDGGGSYWRTVDVDHEGMQKGGRPEYAAPRHAERFEQWLQDSTGGFVIAPDYLLDPADPQVAAKHTFAMFGFATPAPGRWFEFDNGGSVPVRAGADGQVNTVSDEFGALRDAIGAWNNHAGSRVGLAWAGTGSSTADSAINVRWNDPNGEIAGSFDCSRGGVLGIGGSSATLSQTATFGGYTWARRLRGFVVIQDGAGCSMDRNGGKNGAELLAHELGHVLALGHSCGDASSGSCDTTAKNQATMRATLHGDGRGATLGSDDLAGIAGAYPQPTVERPALVMHNGFER